MSATATSPKVTARPATSQAGATAAARARNHQNPAGPMRGLPAIPRVQDVNNAQARRRQWNPPKMIPGEMVFFRKTSAQDEYPAWVIKSVNKTFTLLVQLPNVPAREILSVAFYDHTDPAKEVSGDPMAGNNSNGTFRRSEFGKTLKLLMDALGEGDAREEQPPPGSS